MDLRCKLKEMAADEKTSAELAREVEKLRRELGELKIAARRYHALFDNTELSLQVLDPHGQMREANTGFDALWRIPRAALVDYNMLEDKQLEASGILPRIRHAFETGEVTKLPVIRYDPNRTEGIGEGTAGWVGASLFPVRDEAGKLVEVLIMHYEIGQLTRSEEELRAQNEALEAAVTARTRELSEHLRLLKEQQHSILELSTPVIRLWEGILALPLIGMIDAVRAAQIMENLLTAIVNQRASQVILDVTGVPIIDTSVASYLIKTVSSATLLGASCILVGISPQIAQTLVHLDVDFGRLTTAASLEDGLRQALARANQRIVTTPRAVKGQG